MFKRSKPRKQDTRVHDTLTQIGGEDVEKVLPARVLKSQRRDKGVAKDHQERSNAHKCDELSPSRHDDAGDETADGRCEGGDGESGACFGGRVEEDDLEEEGEVEEVLRSLLVWVSRTRGL